MQLSKAHVACLTQTGKGKQVPGLPCAPWVPWCLVTVNMLLLPQGTGPERDHCPRLHSG